MTKRQYKRLGYHWSVMCSAQRPTNYRALWFDAFALLGRERRSYGITPLYRCLLKVLAIVTAKQTGDAVTT